MIKADTMITRLRGRSPRSHDTAISEVLRMTRFRNTCSPNLIPIEMSSATTDYSNHEMQVMLMSSYALDAKPFYYNLQLNTMRTLNIVNLAYTYTRQTLVLRTVSFTLSYGNVRSLSFQ